MDKCILYKCTPLYYVLLLDNRSFRLMLLKIICRVIIFLMRWDCGDHVNERHNIKSVRIHVDAKPSIFKVLVPGESCIFGEFLSKNITIYILFERTRRVQRHKAERTAPKRYGIFFKE